MSDGLLSRFRRVAGERSLRPNTVERYTFWLKNFHSFTGKPASQWRDRDISDYIHHLRQDRYSSTSRKQALCAVIFAFKHILQIEPGALDLPPAPKTPDRLKVIPSREEIGRVISGMRGQARLMALVMYGSGVRVEECCHLRVQDIDFSHATIRVHSGKGDKDRLTLLPAALAPALHRQIAWRSALHERDLADGAGFVELPGRLSRKYPSAPRELGWQYLFPSTQIRRGHRWHTTPEAVGKAVRLSRRAAGVATRLTPHTFRHGFATHAMQAGNDPATIQRLLGHTSLQTTMTYLHGDRARGVSPLDCHADTSCTPRA